MALLRSTVVRVARQKVIRRCTKRSRCCCVVFASDIPATRSTRDWSAAVWVVTPLVPPMRRGLIPGCFVVMLPAIPVKGPLFNAVDLAADISDLFGESAVMSGVEVLVLIANRLMCGFARCFVRVTTCVVTIALSKILASTVFRRGVVRAWSTIQLRFATVGGAPPVSFFGFEAAAAARQYCNVCPFFLQNVQ